jgi:heterodisulfide reductase subunit A2
MADAGRHPNITLLTQTEIKSVSGYVGNFQVEVVKKARYVTEGECTACGDCVSVCPVLKPNEFNMGLDSRRAIYQPFPQAIPSAYVLDMENCLGRDPVVCGKCIDACEKKCIDFNMSDEELSFKVGTMIVATGIDVYDPTEMDEYGYTRYENVITSPEFERLIDAGGPTQGQVLRLTDRKPPKSVAFIQCVGSRSQNRGEPYCSNVCCMETVKNTLLLREHDPDLDVKVFYIDIRAFGKGFEDLFRRSKGEGVRYIRGLPGSVREDRRSKDLILTVENTATNQLEEHRADMVVLAVGMKPPEDMKLIQEMLALQKNADGFYLEAHPKLQPVDSATRGIFFAGCAEGPKDIKDSVTQASAAAARSMRILNPRQVEVEAITAEVAPELCNSCGICAKVCPFGAISVDTRAKTPAAVTVAACAGCGTCAAECPKGAIVQHHFTDGQIEAQVDAILEEDALERIPVFACNWCSYAGADFAGVSRLQYPANTRLIRTMCSGRVSERHVWRAFEKGAPVVLVSGCHIGDCHYLNANHWTERRIKRLQKKMEKIGLRAERLQLEWISAAEGVRFRDVMEKMESLRQGVTQDEVIETKRVLQARASEE